jgi:hypothetical protein
MDSLQFLYLSFFITIGSFIVGFILSWIVKDYLEDFIDNAAYAKAVTHPEMLDEDGRVLQDELLYLHITDDDAMMDEEDE